MLNTFVSYDDVNSVELKADYIIEHGLAGAIIWEITGDYIETFPGSGVVDETPLATALNNALCQNSICLGDFNNDQLRNTSDLLIMIGYLGQNCGSPYCSGDLSGDAIVNVSDLLLMMSLFGTECL
jgi:hypothetical protein